MNDSHTSPYTREALACALEGSQSLADVIAKLGLENSPYRRKYVGQRLRDHGLDRSRLRSARLA